VVTEVLESDFADADHGRRQGRVHQRGDRLALQDFDLDLDRSFGGLDRVGRIAHR
jgi:hypothetical protein